MSSDTPITDGQVRLHYVRLDGEDLLRVEDFVPFVRQLERENVTLRKELETCQAFYRVAVSERNAARKEAAP